MLLPFALCAAGTSSCMTSAMLGDFAVGDAEDIDGHHGFGSPSENNGREW
jgi:hypothetical protein